MEVNTFSNSLGIHFCILQWFAVRRLSFRLKSQIAHAVPNYTFLEYLSPRKEDQRSGNLLEKSLRKGFQVSLEKFSLAIQFIYKVLVDLFHLLKASMLIQKINLWGVIRNMSSLIFQYI